ncbi:predicted protein [Lichtheimia corymbifera JMRC:FSU:9682]|uniref:F-box domain-containing protein n=1 Tax=Lichtheimia corymbifera JMRC:FSU:9682 TaxID=1263082 RepID=A0A068SGR8_9FUNG|nr:predicted protein [Lichtheimia corymbifera JMRC:FSU:9682]
MFPPITERHIATPPRVTFDRLREIRYPVDIDEDYLPWILWMIRHAPRLESVETVYGSRQSPVMDDLSLPYHEHFKRIGMFADHTTTQWPEEQFIQHHMAIGIGSNLREISLRIGEHSVSESWILLIAQLVRLTHLEILCYEHCEMDLVVSSFIPAIAAGCPALEQFTFVSKHHRCHYDDIVGMSSHTD